MSDIFIPEVPPLMLSPDGRVLAEYLNRQMLAISTFLRANEAGHAGIQLSTPTDTADQTITQTPTKLVGFDTNKPGDNGALGDQANDNIILLEPGLWIVGINFVFDIDVNTANISREVIARLYNDTDGASVVLLAGGTIPRYGTHLSFSGTGMVNLTDQTINKAYSIYLNTLTTDAVILEQAFTMEYYVMRVSSFEFTGV